jgi:hypothetical protein
LLEPNRQPVPIGKILISPRVDHLPNDPFEPEFEKRASVDFEQPVRDVDAEIGINPEQIGIEGRVMIFVNGSPFDTIGCPNCSSASMTM